MKGITLILVCAVALAQAYHPQRSRSSGEICRCPSEIAANTCSSYGTDNELIPHENCNQFYKCSNGEAIPYFCPAELLYDLVGNICDWPFKVQCGFRPVVDENEVDCCQETEEGSDAQPENGDSGSATDNGNNESTCNCKPGDAPDICSEEGSDGILVAHENCNYFYKCDHDVPVSICCPLGFLYNPYLERCDWAHNVVCGERPIVEYEDGENNSSNEDFSNESNNGNAGDNGSQGTCNCNPGEAPGICATDGSNGILIAHENCNQFYKCDHGTNVALNCPSGLLYNPYAEVCDWPHNVECGDRPIVEIDNGNNGDNNGSGNENGDNNGNGNGENDTGNGDNGSGNGNGDNGTGSGTCNCNPGEAPGICAADGSNGILIAHENCNQFYKCDHGINVAFNCPSGLLYNPYTEVCDWPHNVECGDRPIVEIDNGNNGDNNGSGNGDNNGNGNGENDTGNGDNGSGNGNGDNGTGSGTCNCNPGEAPGICAADGSNGILIAHENCNQFYKCDHGTNVAFNCPSGLLYNPYAEVCDWPHNVECGDRPIVEIDNGNNGDNNGSGNGNGDNNGNGNGENDTGNGDNGSGNGNGDNGTGSGTCNCNPGEAPGICAADGSNGILIAHENCNQFYKCDHGINVAFNCPSGLLYNPYTEVCDWPHNVECGDRPIVEIDNGNNGDNNGSGNGDNNGNGNGENDTGNGDNGSGNGNGDNGTGSGTCNCNPGEAPGICAADGSNGILIAHENCNQFYKCDHGTNVAFNCPSGLLYNPYAEVCDWPHNVECGDRPIVEIDNGNNGDNNGSGNENGDNNGNGNGENDTGNGDNGSGNGNGDNGTGSGTCNCNPGEAPGICAADGSNGILIAHENCNQFYKCDHGINVAFNCPSGLLYNPYTEVCDWPHNVECGDRPIVEIDNGNNGDNNGSGNGNGDNNGNGNGENDTGNGDNGSGNGNGDNGTGSGTCNCNPGEAPGICAADGSNGILIAHENCNQFYKCDHGINVAFNCPSGLLYNPYAEVCDWPLNVECGDRPIVEIDNGNNGDNNGSGNGNGDNNGNGNGENDTGNGDNGSGNGNGDNGTGSGTCNCNPGEAPGICAADGSNGILIAHENCNQFYKCDHGINVAFNCPSGLLYNPYTEVCDWPHNVECGDRPIVEIDNGNNGDNNGSGNGNGDNNGNGNGENDTGNGDNGSGNGNGDNGTGSGTCNCNPGEAPGICAADGSNGILIAHENCNQFYKCDHGINVAFNCPSGLLYNPYTEVCDWPHNVECGDRPIVEIDNGNNGDSNGSGNGNGDNNGNGNGENDTGNGDNVSGNGNGDNGTGSGTCNCNPGEAPGICAADGSNGILIAHENCNQFYKCDHGTNVALNCPSGLLYNPYTEVCDWPHNVECGDRPIVEIDNGGDNGETEGSGNGDNGSGNGNGDNGDGDNGTCNCNPGEAPGICATDESDGILIAHENCNQFYKCDHGTNVAFNCPSGLLYNPFIEKCDWPHKVECGDRPVVEIDNGGDNNGVTEGNGNGDNGNNGDNGGICKCNPEEAPAICANGNSEGVLIAHEKCNKFYKCSFGNPVALACPGTLFYNPLIEVCDWPENVKCGDRVISDAGGDNGGDNNGGDKTDGENNGGENNGGDNSEPSQAPSICAVDGSDGILVAHENCDQFYVCSLNTPVVLDCPGNLLYNPKNEQCDWPRNVNCGDRVTPPPTLEGEEGVCLCNPRQAPSICSGNGSDGKMIAHEDCNQYYVCFNGTPITRRCPTSLFYDPQTRSCNWPAAVSCEGRVEATHFSLNKHMQARRGVF